MQIKNKLQCQIKTILDFEMIFPVVALVDVELSKMQYLPLSPTVRSYSL